jgi:ADP-heptose:LPS heptosyltransferase/lauroyl/myristoyl acyltransferase
MVIFIKIIGFLISVLPVSVLERITNFLGLLLVTIPNKRKRIIFSNLKYAFPEWDKKKIYFKGRESAVRLIEMGFLSLSYSFFSGFRKRSLLLMDQYTEDCLSDLRKSGEAVIFLIPHVCLFETLAISPFFRPFGGKRLGAIYRPNRNPKLDQFIIKSRSTAGIKVFARDSALWGARDFLKRGNWLGLLFDQHSGIQGCHSYFLNRFASITTMPELLAKTSSARVIFSFPRRVGFFQAKLELQELTCEPADYPFEAHKMLEETIRFSDGLPEWLWAHERWKTQQNYRFHLRHRHKREKIPSLPARTTKLWIRMPNWLGDVVMTFGLIEAIRNGRPDTEISLIAKPQYQQLFSDLGIGDKFISLPDGNSVVAYKDFWRNRHHYPSLIINFANSFRSDVECCLLGAPARYGLELPGRKRPLLSHTFSVPKDFVGKDTKIHQTEMWTEMLKYFGLSEIPEFRPCFVFKQSITKDIGLLPGSSNNPAKRWPIENWRALIKEFLKIDDQLCFKIYGSTEEIEIGETIRQGFNEKQVMNFCGATNLSSLCKQLAYCASVIGNDSGGMHLANLLGLQTIVLFGPTNPRATKPIYGDNSNVVRAHFDIGMKNSKTTINEILKLFVNENY